MAEWTIKEFQDDQRAFFDKALLAALPVVSSIVDRPIEEASYIADAAVLIALELVKKRQVLIDNGEI